MSYQYKPTKIQLRANVSEDTDKIITSIALATGKAKGKVIEDMLNTNELFLKAKSIKEIIEEEHIEKLKKELGI
ncbi:MULTISPECIES: hypothetical protein [Arcobacteraceae]|uniref:hypothetical protein n=1 Tax=Arcobacteraceae TaxID=2808963 RepID=UPI0021B400DB|nr:MULTISPECIES: hypothetical protein [Arcobacteraceae]MCT7549826.1 hypothetical protein [Aliarcobacter butzleri]MCT7559864.1 hypothetical protein [Aliarcobacter butzleri]MCT7633910.1 hypothetical protein [Aliarcobacter butzleri]MCT7643459.1 hypothetical protein [Aliarcobacter butzleri]MCT7911665.1 hypothetical protein [Arcobacter lacus]